MVLRQYVQYPLPKIKSKTMAINLALFRENPLRFLLCSYFKSPLIFYLRINPFEIFMEK